MKQYECIECGEEKAKARFNKCDVDRELPLWICKQCVADSERYFNSPEVQEEFHRQMEKND